MMKATVHATVDLKEFLEIVLMWHCAGNIPMNRQSTCEFIEDPFFAEFLQSVRYWAARFGVQEPSRSEVVRVLHELY